MCKIEKDVPCCVYSLLLGDITSFSKASVGAVRLVWDNDAVMSVFDECYNRPYIVFSVAQFFYLMFIGGETVSNLR